MEGFSFLDEKFLLNKIIRVCVGLVARNFLQGLHSLVFQCFCSLCLVSVAKMIFPCVSASQGLLSGETLVRHEKRQNGCRDTCILIIYASSCLLQKIFN